MILVFGSLNVDLVFEVPALPRPGETVLAAGYAQLPGGKGANQAVAAARVGASVAMAGVAGDDGFGAAMRAVLVKEGIDTSLIATGTGPTGCAAVAVDRHAENAIVVGSGANREVRADAVPDNALQRATTLLLQHEVPIEESASLAARAKRFGARTILNLAPAGLVPAEMFLNLDFLVTNAHEATSLLGVPSVPGEAGAALAGRFGVTAIVTQGVAGASLHRPDGTGLRIGALPARPIDTTGAGDAFVGIFAARLDRGRDMADALQWASFGAALACQKPGAQEALPDAAAVESRIRDLAPPVAIRAPA